MRDYDAWLDSHAFLGEAMPAFRPGFGPDQFAAFLGAPLVINPESRSTSWSEKIVDDWSRFLPLRLDDDNLYWRRMREFHEIAAAHFRGRCLLHEIDFHSNIDGLEGLRGAMRLLYDLIDTPEIVATAMDQAHERLVETYEALYQYGDKATLGTTSALPLYSRGRFNRIQSDFVCLLNPALFRRFVLGAIEREAELFERSCFHLDGPDALLHLDDLLAVEGIDSFQWVPGAGNPPQTEWPEVLTRMQAAGKAVILHLSADAVRAVHGTYRPELVVYDVHADSVDEGLRLLDWLADNT